MINDFFQFAYCTLTDNQKEAIEVKYNLVKYVEKESKEKLVKDRIFDFWISEENLFQNSFDTLQSWYYDFKRKEKLNK